jgi:hypothetical protein
MYYSQVVKGATHVDFHVFDHTANVLQVPLLGRLEEGRIGRKDISKEGRKGRRQTCETKGRKDRKEGRIGWDR